MALEKFGVGLMTNGKEETVDGNVEGLLVGFAEMTYQVGTLYTVVAMGRSDSVWMSQSMPSRNDAMSSAF